jgi:hypothetical protein
MLSLSVGAGSGLEHHNAHAKFVKIGQKIQNLRRGRPQHFDLLSTFPSIEKRIVTMRPDRGWYAAVPKAASSEHGINLLLQIA